MKAKRSDLRNSVVSSPPQDFLLNDILITADFFLGDGALALGTFGVLSLKLTEETKCCKLGSLICFKLSSLDFSAASCPSSSKLLKLPYRCSKTFVLSVDVHARSALDLASTILSKPLSTSLMHVEHQEVY